MSAKTVYVILLAILATRARIAGAQTVPATPPRSTAETPIPAAGTFIVPSRSKAKGFTGISYSGEVSLDASDEAIWADFPVVAAVAPGSPGAMAGVKVGDAILSVNGADGRKGKPFRPDGAGVSFLIRVRRGSDLLEFTVVSVSPPATTSGKP